MVYSITFKLSNHAGAEDEILRGNFIILTISAPYKCCKMIEMWIYLKNIDEKKIDSQRPVIGVNSINAVHIIGLKKRWYMFMNTACDFFDTQLRAPISSLLAEKQSSFREKVSMGIMRYTHPDMSTNRKGHCVSCKCGLFDRYQHANKQYTRGHCVSLNIMLKCWCLFLF